MKSYSKIMKSNLELKLESSSFIKDPISGLFIVRVRIIFNSKISEYDYFLDSYNKSRFYAILKKSHGKALSFIKKNCEDCIKLF